MTHRLFFYLLNAAQRPSLFPKKFLFLSIGSCSSDAADGIEFFRFALPDAKPRRTRIAKARSERPSERQCTQDVGAPPRARGI